MNYISFLKERWHIVIAFILLLMAFSATAVLFLQIKESIQIKDLPDIQIK
jgi:hypothetical protein